jgi:uncharacterized membrane protein YagU involved in acid resistance
MGGFMKATTSKLAIIGALYGIESPVVSWVTHMFHSVTFALLLVAVVAGIEADRLAPDGVRTAAIGAGFGATLWLLAAGLLMPAWARLLGVAVPFPNLPLTGLVAHLLWGVTAGTTYRAVRGGGPWLRNGGLGRLFPGGDSDPD